MYKTVRILVATAVLDDVPETHSLSCLFLFLVEGKMCFLYGALGFVLLFSIL
jgi:hypothetical protein